MNLARRLKELSIKSHKNVVRRNMDASIDVHKQMITIDWSQA